MAVNEVYFGDELIMSVTDTTATPEDVLDGEVFYGSDGVRRTGNFVPPPPITVDDELSLTSENPVQNKVITQALNEKGTYSKPNTGIPKSDLASDVQASLGKADGAATPEDVYKAYPIDSLKDSLINFLDGADNVPVKKLLVDINPVQDLNGYDNPWPAGGGANKLPPYNAATQTLGTTTCTFDGNGVCTLKAVADSTARTFTFDVTPFTTPTGTCYIHLLNSAANSGVTTSFRDASDNAIGGTFSLSSSPNRIIALTEEQKGQVVSKIRVYKNAAQTDFELTFSPMLLETNAATTTYIPYTNICPITGHTGVEVTRTGKNMLPVTLAQLKARNLNGRWAENVYTINQVAFTISTNQDGVITKIVANGQATSAATLVFTTTETHDIFCGCILTGCPSNGSATTYQITGYNTTTRTNIGARDLGNGCVIPIGLKGQSFRIYINISAGYNAQNLEFFPMIRTENTDATFEPYIGTSVTIDLDGTIYGGTLDVLTGVLTVDRVRYAFGGTEQKGTLNTGANGNRCGIVLPNRLGIKDDSALDFICNIGTPNANANQNTPGSWSVGMCAIYYGATGIYFRYVFPTTVTTNTDALAWLVSNGCEIIVPLATPQTIQLDPETLSTLLGDNNVWADTGDVSLTYRADPTLYIQKLTGSEEDDMIADNAIASGKYFLVGNRLFKSTAAIAAGAQLTIGTNCVETNLAEALNAINT